MQHTQQAQEQPPCNKSSSVTSTEKTGLSRDVSKCRTEGEHWLQAWKLCLVFPQALLGNSCICLWESGNPAVC